MQLTERQDAAERQAIFNLYKALFKEKKLTIARAQEIVGDVWDADALLEGAIDLKTVMVFNNQYELTHKGMVGAYRMAYPEAQVHFGKEELNEDELMQFARDVW